MKKLIIFLLTVALTFSNLTGNVNSYSFSNGWQVNYSIVGDYINIETKVNNKGNIGFGFGGNKMFEIDIALLTYDGSKVIVQDRSYITPPAGTPRIVLQDIERTPPGTTDCEDQGSTYDPNTGDWNVSFRRKLKSNDIWDNEIKDDTDMQVAIAIFGQFEWGKKHLFRECKTVHLTSANLNPNPGNTGNTGNAGETYGSGTNAADSANTAQSSTFSAILVSTIINILAILAQI